MVGLPMACRVKSWSRADALAQLVDTLGIDVHATHAVAGLGEARSANEAYVTRAYYGDFHLR